MERKSCLPCSDAVALFLNQFARFFEANAYLCAFGLVSDSLVSVSDKLYRGGTLLASLLAFLNYFFMSFLVALTAVLTLNAFCFDIN